MYYAIFVRKINESCLIFLLYLVVAFLITSCTPEQIEEISEIAKRDAYNECWDDFLEYDQYMVQNFEILSHSSNPEDCGPYTNHNVSCVSGTLYDAALPGSDSPTHVFIAWNPSQLICRWNAEPLN